MCQLLKLKCTALSQTHIAGIKRTYKGMGAGRPGRERGGEERGEGKGNEKGGDSKGGEGSG